MLHLRTALLDGVEVGRVGRQVTERSPGLLDEFSDAVHFGSAGAGPVSREGIARGGSHITVADHKGCAERLHDAVNNRLHDDP